MRCPACRHPALEHDQACARCGFSLDGLAQQMGIPPVLNAPIADLSRVLGSSARRMVLRSVRLLHQRFPQLSFAVVLMDLAPELSPTLHAFGLFNRGSLFSAVERGGDNHGVLLLLDTAERHAVAMIGYGLEPFVSEMVLDVCLTAASGSLSKGRYGPAIEAFIRELERQLTQIIPSFPRTFGYVEKPIWIDSGSGATASLAVADNDGDDLY